MTTPQVVPGAQVYDAAPATPDAFGLYDAAAVADLAAPSRLPAGVIETPLNCGPAGHGTELCPEPGTEPFDYYVDQGDGTRRESDATWQPVNVWVADYCSLVGRSDEQGQAAAAQLMRLQESVQVEQAFAEVLGATTPASAGSFVAALGALEALLHRRGMVGVIHADRSLAAVAASLHLTELRGGKLTTALGNRWAFGDYADGLGTRLAVTGPVMVRRGPLDERVVVSSPTTNDRTVLVQRTVVVSTQCVMASATTGV